MAIAARPQLVGHDTERHVRGGCPPSLRAGAHSRLFILSTDDAVRTIRKWHCKSAGNPTLLVALRKTPMNREELMKPAA
jgi:hypothetical protein